MFPFQTAFIGFAVLTYLFESYLDYRQYKKLLIEHLPKNLEHLSPHDKFLKSQQYGRAKKIFGVISATYDLIQTVVLLHIGALPFLWDYSGSLLGKAGFDSQNELARAVVFLILSYFFTFITHLPFSLYETFVLEERFGFNKQTWKLYVIDTIKSTILFFLFGIPIMIAVLKVIEWGGNHFWIYLWAFSVVMSLFVATIYPTLIAPWFNKYTELEEGELKTAIFELADRLKFPLTKLYVVDGSTRSSHSNAYFYGFFKNKRIVIYDTLLKQVNKEELVSILGHELGHWQMNHTLFHLLISFAYFLVFFYIFGQTSHNPQLFKSFGFDSQPIFIGLILFAYIYSPVEHVFSFLMHIVSRLFEFQADAFAVALNYGSQLKEALVKIHVENASNILVDHWYAAYHHTHPTLVERMKAIDRLVGTTSKKAQ